MARIALLLAGLALVGFGLFCVSLELGRPLRALNVFRNPRTSWMAREAWTSLLLVPAVLAAAAGAAGASWLAMLLALAFVPVGCQHCDDPPCADVCPTTATKKRADGIVTIDYDLCIGCAYCAVACPYQARYKTQRPAYAYGPPMANETKRRDDSRLGVATKCTFCVERIDAGLAKGQRPGVDPEATPACVNACITQALSFGDLDDPDSSVSKLVASNRHFRMHEELGTGPGFYYLWDAAPAAAAAD